MGLKLWFVKHEIWRGIPVGVKKIIKNIAENYPARQASLLESEISKAEIAS